MRPSQVYRSFFMAISSEWVHSHLPHKSQDLTLCIEENEKTWHVKCKYRVGVGVGASSGLDGGWKDFAFENNLEESDVSA
ncbi:hypothetical protein RHGRI_023559 [Rhododendron griersonianum]|uniref:TF-B3 domain-containing protein n=1 Tax=Rhododendron griersonianum TaxID=479676 RepID=A0AAV6J9H0_9ERIC|nr:hypothetical protein RHGRI_023559 [Rhododendron griersonianum]